MKTLKLYTLLAVILFACADKADIKADTSIPESETLFSPPSWLIGNWIDEAGTQRFLFEIENIRLSMNDTTINFTEAYPTAHEDYKTPDIYQFSAIIDDEIRIRYTFERKLSNKLDYTLKIMGAGPTIELIKR